MRQTRILMTCLVAAVTLAGSAAALPDAQRDVALATQGAQASTSALLDATERYADLDASAVTDEAAAALDADASASDPATAQDAGAFAWLDVSLDAVLTRLADLFALLGQDAPDASGDASAYASDEGVDVDASTNGRAFDETPAGEADDSTWETASRVPDA